MRLIDADKLKAHFAWWKGGTREMTMDEAKSDFDCIIDLQPTVEADPIVRCKACKWYDKISAFCDYWADIYGHAEVYPRHTPIDYCSRGERKESEE